jgi:endonuclease/exonuclease/phosphatase family metal-dependent hydrolase
VSLRLITWNIQWCRGADGRVDPARIVSAARGFADFDVLCLQEVARNYPGLAGSSGEDQFAILVSLLPGYTLIEGVATDVLAPDGTRRQFGNAIITRLPVLQVFRHLLPWLADDTVPSMQRAALEVVLQSAAGPLRVTTTHLEYYSSIQRTAQAERLRDLQEKAARRAHHPSRMEKIGGPFARMPLSASAILTGDFNFRPEDPLHARMQAQIAAGVPSYRDAWQVRHPREKHPPTLGMFDREQWPEPPFCCDFIFATEDLAPRIEDVVVDTKTDASDHQPVLLVLSD